MKLKVKITGIKYVNHLDAYWSNEDYIELLNRFDFNEADQVKPDELKEILYMAMTDYEPNEAAQILLTYKLEGQLTEGQIQSLSHEMIEDKVAEEYPEPELHFDLFNINQLLYKAYNGTFPNTEASIITIEILNKDADSIEMTEEIMTKLVSFGLVETSIMQRLYADQIEAKVPFEDAAKFIWKLDKKNNTSYELLTSKYWIEKEDFKLTEYECNIAFFDDGK